MVFHVVKIASGNPRHAVALFAIASVNVSISLWRAVSIITAVPVITAAAKIPTPPIRTANWKTRSNV